MTQTQTTNESGTMTDTQKNMQDMYQRMFANDTAEYAAKWLAKNANVGIKTARAMVKKFDLAGF